MTYKFTKMHGAGNDYIYFDCFEDAVDSPGELSVKLSDRHFGIGGDGIVLICPSKIADARMRMFNSDGSEGKMCGNAVRCVGKYLYDSGRVQKTKIDIETLSGIKSLELNICDGRAVSARVNMGKAELNPKALPALFEGDKVIGGELEAGGLSYKVTLVSMGNPHCVVFCGNIGGLDLERTGRLFENHRFFPERVNTEFVEVLGKNRLKMRVWERGSGETLACGTGACAAAVAAVLNGYCEYNEKIAVGLLGGELIIEYKNDGTVYMTGGAHKVFQGEIEA